MILPGDVLLEGGRTLLIVATGRRRGQIIEADVLALCSESRRLVETNFLELEMSSARTLGSWL